MIKKISTSILAMVIMMSMIFCSGVFATELNETLPDIKTTDIQSIESKSTEVGVVYRGHIQNVGDYPLDNHWVEGPGKVGTQGLALRLEGFWIQITNKPTDMNLVYQVHVQNRGWMDWVENGNFGGTEGQSLQIEAVRIKLVDDAGAPVEGYSVTYNGHIENVGDTDWVKDGEELGTTGRFLRLEALRVLIVKTTADLDAYNAALAAVNQGDYTASTWAVYQKVVAENVVSTENKQAEVDQATANIIAAQAKLILVTQVTDVRAINSTQATVTFSGSLQAMNETNFTITDDSGVSLPVSEVVANPIKTVATLTVENAFIDGETYIITAANLVDSNGDLIPTSNTAFTYIKGEVASVEFFKTTIAPGDNAKNIVKVIDSFGRDITKEVQVTLDSANPGLIDQDGLVHPLDPMYPWNDYALLVAYVDNVQSAQTKIIVTDRVATTFVGYNIFELNEQNPAATTADFEALADRDKKQFVYPSERGEFGLALYYLDQYGDSMKAYTAPNMRLDKVALESLDAQYLYTDDLGVIYANNPGNAEVKIRNGSVESTITIEVKADPIISAIELEKNDVKVLDGFATTVDMVFKDQYGIVRDVVPSGIAETLTIAHVTTRVNQLTVSGILPGTTKVTVNPAQSVDGYAIKPGLTASINVTVVEQGDIAGYDASADTTKLDINGTPGGTPSNTAVISLKAFDSKGNDLGDVGAGPVITLKEVNAAGNAIVNPAKQLLITPGVGERTITADKNGTAYVQVWISSLLVDTLTFEITNTTQIPTSVSVENSTYAIVSAQADTGVNQITLEAELKNNIASTTGRIVVYDQYGQPIDPSTLNPANFEVKTDLISVIDLEIPELSAFPNTWLLQNSDVPVTTPVTPPIELDQGSAELVVHRIAYNPSGTFTVMNPGTNLVIEPVVIPISVTRDTSVYTAATAAVEKFEASTYADVVAIENAIDAYNDMVSGAQTLVTKLPSGEVKDSLQARIDAERANLSVAVQITSAEITQVEAFPSKDVGELGRVNFIVKNAAGIDIGQALYNTNGFSLNFNFWPEVVSAFPNNDAIYSYDYWQEPSGVCYVEEEIQETLTTGPVTIKIFVSQNSFLQQLEFEVDIPVIGL